MNVLLTERSGKKETEDSQKTPRMMTEAQRRRNEEIYNNILDVQLNK